MSNSTVVVAFKCSCCSSFVKERVLVEYKEDVRDAIVAKTIRCDGCKPAPVVEAPKEKKEKKTKKARAPKVPRKTEASINTD